MGWLPRKTSPIRRGHHRQVRACRVAPLQLLHLRQLRHGPRSLRSAFKTVLCGSNTQWAAETLP